MAQRTAPRESDAITRKAPTEPGECPHLGTSPGRLVSGLKGGLVDR